MLSELERGRLRAALQRTYEDEQTANALPAGSTRRAALLRSVEVVRRQAREEIPGIARVIHVMMTGAPIPRRRVDSTPRAMPLGYVSQRRRRPA